MDSPAAHFPFFVYGTLLPGEKNYQLWREAIDTAHPAVFPGGRLYSLGSFPMLVDAPDGEVRGMVVRIRPSSYSAALALLDQLEGVDLWPHHGPGYRRVRRIVRPAGQPAAVAWVYMGHVVHVASLKPIGPDWKSYLRRHVKSL